MDFYIGWIVKINWKFWTTERAKAGLKPLQNRDERYLRPGAALSHHNQHKGQCDHRNQRLADPALHNQRIGTHKWAYHLLLMSLSYSYFYQIPLPSGNTPFLSSPGYRQRCDNEENVGRKYSGILTSFEAVH